MRRFILSLPSNLQAAFVICGTIFMAFAAANICGALFDHHQLVSNTDLISAVYQAMGTIYAILLTFTLWGVWQHFTDAETSVQNETYALLDLVHMIESIPGDTKVNLRKAALAYISHVIEKEWPAIRNLTNEQLNLHEQQHNAAHEIMATVQGIQPKNEREMVIFGQSLTLLTSWLDARRTRILSVRGNNARALWPLLYTGAIVLFAFHGLFVANTLSIWIMLLFGTSLVIGVTFYLIFSLDSPYSGTLCIDAEPFLLAIGILQKELACHVAHSVELTAGSPT